jgi:alpha-L-fucosidase
VTLSRIRIHEAVAERVRRFEFQHRDGAAWQTLFTGDKIGRDFERVFPPLTARGLRLNILDATDGPTIAEFELLEK